MAKITNNFILLIYNLLFIIFSNSMYLVYLILKIFSINNIKLNNRLGINLPPIAKSIIWIHGASVGELNSTKSLILKLLNQYPNHHVLITSHTKTSKQIILNDFKNQSNITHLYLPYDSKIIIKKFLSSYNIKLVLWIEQDFFINILNNIAKKNIPLLLLNARMSEKSFKKWLKLDFFIKPLLNKFHNIYAMSMNDANRFALLSGKDINYIGNLKYTNLSNYNANIDINLYNKLNAHFANHQIFLALSTHNQEEDIIIRTHLRLIKHIPNLLTIIIPRHINRVKNITNKLRKNYKVNIDIWENNNEVLNNNIIMVNKMGYTNLFCSLSPITFIGRSLSTFKKGGQNLLEPISCRSIPVFGIYMHNFKNITQEVLELKAGFEVDNEDALYNILQKLYDNNTLVKETRKNTLEIIKKQGDILNKHMEAIQCYLTQ
jgi:3-deoxy-D-manno-octulosonic-acid transferase